METKIFKVVSQSEASYIPSREGGQLAKATLRLRELGNGKYGDEFVCSLFGNAALCRLYENDVVAAKLRFQVHEVNGASYQDVVCGDYVKLNA